MSIDIRQLQQFVVLAEELHFTRAAERLHVTQPTLTNQIKQLESSLGISLFERSTRQVSLTDAGQLMLASARAATSAFNDVLGTAAALRRGVTGQVTLGLPTRLRRPSRYDLARLVARQAPAIALDFSIENNVHLIERVVHGTLDAAVCYGPVPTESVRAQAIYTDHAVAVMPSTHPLASRREISVGELADDKLILPSARFVAGNWVLEDWYAASGIPRVVSSTTWDYDESHSAVMQGEGVEVTPSLLASQKALPGISVVPIGDGELMDAVLFVISRHATEGSAIATVAECVASYFAKTRE